MKKLFNILSSDLVNAYNDCIKLSEVLQADARVYGFLANSAGTGAFAEIAAESLAAFSRSLIEGDRPDIVDSFGFTPLDSSYVRWKVAQGYSSNFWELTGATSTAIVSRPTAGGFVTTIDDSVSVPRIGWDGTQRGAFDAATIVGWLEKGTKHMEARPLISLASIRFLGVNYSKMERSANTLMNKWLKENHADANNYLRNTPHRKTNLAQVASASPSSEFSLRKIRGALNKRILPAKEKLKAKFVVAKIMGQSGALEREIKQVTSKVRV